MRRHFAWLILLLPLLGLAAQARTITKEDQQIDGADPSIRSFVRMKMAEGNARFTDDNIVVFVHGATTPSTPDFDMP